MFKVTQKEDGFFAEAHVKLRPSDFATDGVFLAGLCHAPKSLDESITQAKAAAARAVTLLSKKSVAVSGIVARVDGACCSACGVCVSICPVLRTPVGRCVRRSRDPIHPVQGVRTVREFLQVRRHSPERV